MTLTTKLAHLRAAAMRPRLRFVGYDFSRLSADETERLRAIFEYPVPPEAEACARRCNEGVGTAADAARFRELQPAVEAAIDAALAALPRAERDEVLSLLDSTRVWSDAPAN